MTRHCQALGIAAALLWAGPATANDLGLWRAMLSVGDGTPGAVAHRADAARDSMVAFGRDLQIDEPSVSMMDKIREAGIELDLGGLYKMLPHVQGEGHSIQFHGGPEGDSRYLWTLYPPQGVTNDGRLLAVDGISELTPVDQDLGKGKGFHVRQDLDVGTGPWRHGDVAALLQGLLVELELAAAVPATGAALATVNKHQPKLIGGVDRSIAAATFDAAPSLAASLSQSVRVDRVATLTEHGLDVDFVGRMDLQGLSAMGYPKLSKYIDKLDNLLVFDLSVRDSHGLPIVVIGFYSAGPGIRVAFTTHDGALLPRRKGVPDATRPVRLTDRAVDLRMRADVEIRAEGMLLRVSDYEIPLAYRSSGGFADVNVPITSEPTLEFTGQGKFTSWIAEIADSALNLESQGQVIFKAVAEGPDGKGSSAVMRYTDRPTNGVVSSKLNLMMVDNALVRMGFRIVGRHLTPDDQVVAEAMAFVGRLIRDGESDYARVRDALVAWDG